MTVSADKKQKVCELCKRPFELKSSNEDNATGDNVDIKSSTGIPIQCKPKRLNIIECFMPRYLSPSIERIIYWRNFGTTFKIFFGGIMLFTGISYYSVVSVISFLSLAVLASTFMLKILSHILNRNDLIAHWPEYDNLDVIVLKILDAIILLVAKVRDIVFVKDMYITGICCLILFILTMVGDLFDILQCTFMALFIVPKACELIVPPMLKLAVTAIHYLKSRIFLPEIDD